MIDPSVFDLATNAGFPALCLYLLFTRDKLLAEMVTTTRDLHMAINELTVIVKERTREK